MEDKKEVAIDNKKKYKKILKEKGKYCYIEFDKYVLYFYIWGLGIGYKNATDEFICCRNIYKKKEIRCKA